MELQDDALAEIIAERADANPDFPRLVEACRQNRELLDALADRRTELGLSQRAVAQRMGTSQAAVDRLEAGDVDCKLSTIQRYALALGQRVHWQLVDVPVAAERASHAV